MEISDDREIGRAHFAAGRNVHYCENGEQVDGWEQAQRSRVRRAERAWLRDERKNLA